MRMFDRLPREDNEAIQASLPPLTEPQIAIVEQAIDTVARRLLLRRIENSDMIDWGDFADVGEYDWNRIEARATRLIKELDRGQGPFEAAYVLLKRRAEREV